MVFNKINILYILKIFKCNLFVTTKKLNSILYIYISYFINTKLK